MLRRLGQGQRCRCAARAFGLAAVVLIGLAPSQIQRVHPPRPAIRLGQAAATGTRAAEREIRRLIARLDAPRFESRNEAARQLSAKGHAALPYLAEALGQPSSEVRFRARVLLIRHPSFEEVAPHLVIALEKRHGLRARAILHERVLQQLDVIGQSRSADQLFKFWNLDAASFCSRTAASFDDARTGAEIARAVQPLLGLSDRAARFNDAMERLESLALPCAHQYSPGFVIAETLARGLHENHAARAAFAEQHLEAFETLAANLHLRGLPPHAVRKELLDRANFSQGAAGYLAQTLDETAWQRAILSQRIGVSPESLQQEFLHGVASPDLAQYNLGVGKVHIYDMLSEALHAWPDGPHDGVVQRLVGETAKAAATGDKPKALAFLDALDACRDLSQHGLRVQDGLGERLAERLFDAAKEAENNRVYHPGASSTTGSSRWSTWASPSNTRPFPASGLSRTCRGPRQPLPMNNDWRWSGMCASSRASAAPV